VTADEELKDKITLNEVTNGENCVAAKAGRLWDLTSSPRESAYV